MSSPFSLIKLTILGKRVLILTSPGGKPTPSSKRESMSENTSKGRSLSTMSAVSAGTNACNPEASVFVLNVNCFTSEKFSSLGTYTVLLLSSDNGSVQPPLYLKYANFISNFKCNFVNIFIYLNTTSTIFFL